MRRKHKPTADSSNETSPVPVTELSTTRAGNLKQDRLCVLVLIVLTLAVYSPALFGGRVLLPADNVPLMRPWAATARDRFGDNRFTQNQMLGPIFEYYSWRHYARERLHEGEIPLWNPYELGGNVLLANSQSAVLYPPNLLLYTLPLWVGINLVTALHTFLTGFFLYGLLRVLGLRPVAALTGALIWMFCGLQLVWTEFQTPTAVLCWLPGALWGWENYAQGRGWKWAVFGTGTAIALTLLAGHLHFAFYVLLAVGLYGLWTIFRQRDKASNKGVLPNTQRQTPNALLIIFLTFAFGISLSMATMLPVLEMARMNFRAAQGEYAGSIGLRLPPKNLLTLLQPNLYGNPRDYAPLDTKGNYTGGNAYFGAFDFIEYTAYLGIPAVVLSVLAVGYWLLIRRRIASINSAPPPPLSLLPFLLFASLGLLLALGTPVCALFFYLVPGYRQFNATARALCLFSFGMSALAAYGVQALLEAREQGQEKKLAALMGWTCGLAALLGIAAFPGMGLSEMMTDTAGRVIPRLFTDQWFGYELAGLGHFAIFLGLTGIIIWLVLRKPTTPHPTQSVQQPTLNAQNAILWLLPALAAADLLVWGMGFNPATPPGMLGYPTETTDFLKDKAPDRIVSLEAPDKGIKSFIVPNYNTVTHLRDVQGADSLHTRRYHRLLEQVVIASEPGRKSAFTDPNTLHVPNLNHPFFNLMNVRYATTDPDNPLSAPYSKVADAELTVWENPNAFGSAWMVGSAERIDSLESAFTRLSAPDFDPKRTALLEVDAPPLDAAANGSPVQMKTFSPHRLVLEADAKGRGLLLLPEIAFPGWRATVDSLPAPVLTVDYLLRGVPVSSGHHTITLNYEPTSYRLGLYLSAGMLSLLVTFLVSGRRPIRNTSRNPHKKPQ